jgi:hypothetical protein
MASYLYLAGFGVWCRLLACAHPFEKSPNPAAI